MMPSDIAKELSKALDLHVKHVERIGRRFVKHCDEYDKEDHERIQDIAFVLDDLRQIKPRYLRLVRILKGE
jgi:hypothetical protein